jgi:hypothetical protein
MDDIAEYEAQRARLIAAGVKIKYSEARPGSWGIEVVFTDKDDIGDLWSLYSVADVDEFIGSFCPECWHVDRRRTRGGRCSRCVVR